MKIEEMLKSREKNYGKFADHAKIAQGLKSKMEVGKWWSLKDDQKEALEMIAHKIARILNCDPNYADNWTDIAGYATLVSNRLEAETQPSREMEKS